MKRAARPKIAFARLAFPAIPLHMPAHYGGNIHPCTDLIEELWRKTHMRVIDQDYGDSKAMILA